MGLIILESPCITFNYDKKGHIIGDVKFCVTASFSFELKWACFIKLLAVQFTLVRMRIEPLTQFGVND